MKILKVFGLTIPALFVANSAFADLVQIGRVDLYGTGFGAETYVMSLHEVGKDHKPGDESGCIGYIGGQTTAGGDNAAVCAMQDTGEESANGPYAPGDEMDPSHFPHEATPLLSDIGVTTGGQLVVIFNPDQTGPDHPITLADLTVTIWSNAGSKVWQSGDLASDGDFFASTDAGIGKSGIAYGLDTAQASELTSIIISNGGPGALRLGLSAHITQATGGPDAFFVTDRPGPPPPPPPPPAVPEPGSIVLLGSALLGLVTLAKKQIK